MDEYKIYLLLDVIFRNGSVKMLTRNGISFNEIAKLTNNAILEGFVVNSESRIMLTTIGIETLKKLESIYKNRNKEEWIEKDFKSQITKIDENFIFLPKQNELTF